MSRFACCFTVREQRGPHREKPLRHERWKNFATYLWGSESLGSAERQTPCCSQAVNHLPYRLNAGVCAAAAADGKYLMTVLTGLCSQVVPVTRVTQVYRQVRLAEK